MTIHEIKTEAATSAIETLRDALAKQFESVIVLGFKEGKIYTTSSGNDCRLKMVGALESAKHHILEN